MRATQPRLNIEVDMNRPPTTDHRPPTTDHMGYASNWADALGVSSERRDLEGTRKGDRAKVQVTALSRKRTAVTNDWIAERLSMGHHGSVSRLVVAALGRKFELRFVPT